MGSTCRVTLAYGWTSEDEIDVEKFELSDKLEERLADLGVEIDWWGSDYNRYPALIISNSEKSTDDTLPERIKSIRKFDKWDRNLFKALDILREHYGQARFKDSGNLPKLRSTKSKPSWILYGFVY